MEPSESDVARLGATQDLRVSIAADGLAYRDAIPGLDLDVVRTGTGAGPNIVLSSKDEGVTVASGIIQFPLLGRTTVPDDSVAAALIIEAPPGSRWCGADLEPGSTLIYGPGAEHTGISPAGLEYRLMIVPINVLVEDSRHRGFIIELPAPGEIITKHSPLAIEPIVDFLTAAGGAGHAETAYLSTGRVAAAALADVLARTGPTSTRRSLDSRRIVRVCVEYSDRVLDVPTLTDLCQVAHVSERRLRDAFVDTLGKPPAKYLRLRQISRVHEILSRSTRATATVSRTAMDQGVKHLGRFAKRYRETFGELPSETLQRTSIDSDQSGR